VELCRLQLPGRENRWREASFVTMPALVETLATVLQPYLNMPFAFFGHSMGALIAFELARYLRRETAALPAQLFASGRWAPHWPAPDAPLYQLPEAEFITALRQRYDNIPDAVINDPELLALYLPLLRADVTLLDTYLYTPDQPLACPLLVCGGMDDGRVPRAALEAWAEHTTCPLRVQQFPGGHFYLQRQSARSALLQVFSQELMLLTSRL
jgi:medium-chain acyl-[acyl-carrier-protein] hydrolase